MRETAIAASLNLHEACTILQGTDAVLVENRRGSEEISNVRCKIRPLSAVLALQPKAGFSPFVPYLPSGASAIAPASFRGATNAGTKQTRPTLMQPRAVQLGSQAPALFAQTPLRPVRKSLHLLCRVKLDNIKPLLHSPFFLALRPWFNSMRENT